MIREVEITSILDNDFGSINNNPLTIAGITNKQMINGYTEFMFKPVEISCYFKEKIPAVE